MAKLVATQQTNRYRVDRIEDDGSLTVIPFIDPFRSTKSYRQCADHFQVPEKLIVELICNKLERGVTPAEVDIIKPSGPQSFSVRLLNSSIEHPAPDWDTAFALAHSHPEPAELVNIQWVDVESLCGLDVDFHKGLEPLPHELIGFCDMIRPTPFEFWLTKSGGLRLMYKQSGQYTADEIAAVAAYRIAERFPTATFEFLTRTRRPPGEVYRPTCGSADLDYVRKLLGQSVEGTDYSEYLEAHGFVVGQRYPHIQCPVNPSRRAEGNADPVRVFEDHIDCRICAADGMKRGSKTPGYFPYVALTGDRIQSLTASAVINFVHWAQARHMLARSVNSPTIAEKLYRALLKLYHGPDPRIPLVFTACEPIGLIRSDGTWIAHNGEYQPITKDSAMIRALPVTMFIGLDGRPQVDDSKAEQMTKPVDLSELGYPAVHTLRGVHITSSQNLPRNKLYHVTHTNELKDDSNASRRPKYIHGVDSIKLAESFTVLNKILPGLDRDLILLLIAGRGCSEHRSGKLPMLFITGPSGVGKTYHVHIAAAICGDTVGDVTYTRDRSRFMQNFMSQKSNNGVIVFDEFFKSSHQAGDTDEDAMQFLLSMNENSRSHAMYVGPVRIGSIPLLVWADAEYPLSIQQHEQIGRRVHFKRLSTRVYWDEPCKAAGIRDPGSIRNQGSPEIVEACNCILSYVIDTWFSGEATDFAQVASDLAFPLIRDGAAVDEKINLIRELFNVVCDAPEITDEKLKKKFTCKGYKLARADTGCVVYDALLSVWSDEERGTRKIRLVDEMDIATVLGLRAPCVLQITNTSKTTFAVRFVSIGSNSKPDDMYVNNELRKEPTTPMPVASNPPSIEVDSINNAGELINMEL